MMIYFSMTLLLMSVLKFQEKTGCLFTSVHADEENANVDIDFISEQLVDESRVKRSICISDTGIPNDWDDTNWKDGNTVLKPILLD